MSVGELSDCYKSLEVKTFYFRVGGINDSEDYSCDGNWEDERFSQVT